MLTVINSIFLAIVRCMALTMIAFSTDNLFLPFTYHFFVMDLTFVLLFVAPALFFCHSCNPLQPSAPGHTGEVPCSTGQQHGQRRSAGRGLSFEQDLRRQLSEKLQIGGVQRWGLCPVSVLEKEAVLFITLVSPCPTVRFSACFPLCPSCVFHLSRNHWLCLK